MSRAVSRRRFLQSSAAAASLAGLPSWLPGVAKGNVAKEDRPLVAAIGLGTQGTVVARRAAKYADIVAVCDVQRQHAERAKDRLFYDADIVSDYRRVLDRKDVEALFIATPDHWHAPIALAALAAGKHVYLETPLALTIDEGQQLVAMVEKTGLVLQVGSQQRGDQLKTFGRAVATVRGGHLGKINKVTVQLPLVAEQGGPFSAQSLPEGLDWDAWLGQAPNVDYCPERSHVRFRWWYDYAGGIVTDWGAHHLDIVHWALNVENSGPTVIDGTKTMLPEIPGGFTTPKQVSVDYRYPGDIHVQLLAQPPGSEGITFEGERGKLQVGRGRIAGSAIEEQDANESLKATVQADLEQLFRGNTAEMGDHVGNFFTAWQRGRPPISDVVGQHRAASACHLANISIRLRRKLAWDPIEESFVGDAEANKMLKRTRREPDRIDTSG